MFWNGETMSEYSDTLNERRRRLHLTQQELADLATLKLSMVADIESDRQRPNPVVAEQLEKVLKQAEDEFREMTVREGFVLARTEAGLSQEEVAKRAKIDATRYAQWEAGVGGSLGDEIVMRIADVIDAAGEAIDAAAEKKILAETGGLPLSGLGKRPLIERIADRESKKEAKRVLNV